MSTFPALNLPTGQIFPPESFPIVERHRTTAETCASLIIESQEALGVSGHQLARLLGADPSQVWACKAGNRRLGTGYMARLIKLLLLHKSGIPLNLAWSIYWKEGIINWRNGLQSEAGQLLDKQLTEPEPEAQLTQWGGQAGPRTKAKG